MNQKDNTSKPIGATPVKAPKKPNEAGTVSVQGFIKIFDPATRQVYVEKRA